MQTPTMNIKDLLDEAKPYRAIRVVVDERFVQLFSFTLTAFLVSIVLHFFGVPARLSGAGWWLATWGGNTTILWGFIALVAVGQAVGGVYYYLADYHLTFKELRVAAWLCVAHALVVIPMIVGLIVGLLVVVLLAFLFFVLPMLVVLLMLGVRPPRGLSPGQVNRFFDRRQQQQQTRQQQTAETPQSNNGGVGRILRADPFTADKPDSSQPLTAVCGFRSGDQIVDIAPFESKMYVYTSKPEQVTVTIWPEGRNVVVWCPGSNIKVNLLVR